MKDHSKKLNNLKENNESIFGELFGFGKKSPQPTYGMVQKIDVGKYRMGNSLITGIPGATDSEILNFDWENSSLSWLLDCEFEGILNLDLDNGVLKSFGGVWKKGVFKGLAFSNHSTASFGVKGDSQVQFGDGIIKPRYVAPYNTWKVSPLEFVDGTIDRETGGVLGIPDAANGPVSKVLNILSLVPGKSLQISVRSKLPVRGSSGKMEPAPVSAIHSVKMIKRIDSKNSDISIEITNGETNKVFSKTFPWSEFRKSGVQSMQFTPGQTLNFFGLDLSDKNVSAEIVESRKSSLSHSPERDAAVEKKLATSQQVFDLKKLPYINIDKPAPGVSGKMEPGMKMTEVYFYLPTTDYLNKFSEVSKNIENGVLTSDIDIIASGIRSGLISGYYDNKILAPLFNGVVGVGKAPDGYALPLKRLGDFLQFFVDRIYVQGDNAKINKPVQDLIKNKLKKVLQIDSYIKLVAAEPGTTSPSNQAPTEPIKPKIKLKNESIINSLKNIISENLKHF